MLAAILSQVMRGAEQVEREAERLAGQPLQPGPGLAAAALPLLEEAVGGPDWWPQATRLNLPTDLAGRYRRLLRECEQCRAVGTDRGRGRLLLQLLLPARLATSVVLAAGSRPGPALLRLADRLDLLAWEAVMLDPAWLDLTWAVPPSARLELVPATNLGLQVCLVAGRALVTKVRPGSLAAEDGKVEGEVVRVAIFHISLYLTSVSNEKSLEELNCSHTPHDDPACVSGRRADSAERRVDGGAGRDGGDHPPAGQGEETPRASVSHQVLRPSQVPSHSQREAM